MGQRRTGFKRGTAAVGLWLAVCLLLSACSPGAGDAPTSSGGGGGNTAMTVRDNTALYASDDDDSIVTMYLTVRTGNAADNTDHTWTEVNSLSSYDYETMGIEKYKCEAILQVGDEEGPSPDQLGYGVEVPNATVQIRGATSSKAAQKSYQIKIKSGAGEWRGQKTIALNKHPYDSSRLRNKLSYDLIKTIPGMIGLRTQFVHLYVKDQTEGNTDTFVDYGLYTQVEQVNSRYLRNHGLDEYGQLYKATMFEFFRYPDALKLKDDPTYDEKAFEQVLEIKGNDDHSKLLQMLEDLNNYSLPIEEVFARYFDEENYFTWLAFQMLTGNTDTTSQNFFLYSPQSSSTWYFISWDNDGAWESGENLLQGAAAGYNYEKGISNYWGSVLHKRVLQSPTMRQKLDDKVNEIRALVTEEVVAAKVEAYKAAIEPYMYAMPDIMHNVEDRATWEKILQTIPQEIETNYQMYVLSLEYPMPFYYNQIVAVGDTIEYTWDISYDFDDEAITYTFELARDYLFTETLVREEGLTLPRATSDKLPTGQYFVRVTATNASGRTQTAQEYYEGLDDVRRYGVRMFYILPDGSIGG